MCSNSGQTRMLGTSSPPDRTDSAEEELADRSSMQPEPRLKVCLDPFSYSRTLQDTDVPCSNSQTHGDPDVCYTRPAETQSLEPLQPGARRIPYALAIRLANHSNLSTAPLATIIEQGSHSTLNSHGSLLSVGQLPALGGVENVSPSCITQRRSRSLDDKGLEEIKEDDFLEYFPLLVPGGCATSTGELPTLESSTCDVVATPSRSDLDHLQEDSASLRDEYGDNGGMKEFLRGVIQNVRGASHDRSRSCLTSHVPTSRVEQRVRSATYENSPQNCHKQASGQPACHEQALYEQGFSQQGSVYASSRLSASEAQTTFSGTTISSGSNSQVGNGAMLSADGSCMARVGMLLRPVSPSGYERDVKREYATRGQPRAHSTPLQPLSAQTNRHEAAQEQVEHGGFSCRDKVSARPTPDGGSFLSQKTAWLEFDKARDEFASLNASFCGTISTSYSGAVVGVDVDLQHEFAYPVCRSRSATPVWFTRPTAEIGQQALVPESDAARHSITSSALTSLLPIAVASGIVGCDYTKPLLSYYSPSGRQIDRECSSTPETLCYDKQDMQLPGGRVGTGPGLVPPARPVVVRMKTVRKKVRGCGGMVREDSLIPRSGVKHSHGKNKEHWSGKSGVRNVKEVLGAHIGRAMRACFCQATEGVRKPE